MKTASIVFFSLAGASLILMLIIMVYCWGDEVLEYIVGFFGFVIYFYGVIGAIFYVVDRIREEKNEARCRQEAQSANSIGQKGCMQPNNMGDNISA